MLILDIYSIFIVGWEGTDIMKYIYPRLSDKDLLLFRIGGPGLGNLLFVFARSIVATYTYNATLIWPTWPSFKVGPFLRNEKDKRLYINLFKNNSNYVSGFKKWLIIATHKHIIPNNQDISEVINNDNCVICINNSMGTFKDLYPYHKIIQSSIYKNVSSKHSKGLTYNFNNTISMHIRRGDFGIASRKELENNIHNKQIPLSWFIEKLNQLREIAGKNTEAFVFSDGTDAELNELLKINNVKRLTLGSSIADILALSCANILLASGSSFSMWARFLGRCDCICYKGQIKEKMLNNDDESMEIESGLNEPLPEEFIYRIRNKKMMSL